MRWRCALLTRILLSIGLAGTLTLRDGRTVQGSYLGGASRLIRMAVGDKIETFEVSDLSSLQFEGAPAPAVSPDEQRRILRSQPSAPLATTVASAAGAITGGGRGAGAGTAIQVLTQGTRVRVPSETRLTFALEQRIPL